MSKNPKIFFQGVQISQNSFLGCQKMLPNFGKQEHLQRKYMWFFAPKITFYIIFEKNSCETFQRIFKLCLICTVITVKKLKSLWGSFWLLNKEIHDLAKSKKCKFETFFFSNSKSMSSMLCKSLEPIIHVDAIWN